MEFSKEIDQLRSLKEHIQINSHLFKNSKLKLLNPFLDKEGILRVSSRSSNAIIPHSQKHPAILSYNSHVTKLLITLEHQRLLHAGARCTLANLRANYWPLNGRRIVNAIINKCINDSEVQQQIS